MIDLLTKSICIVATLLIVCQSYHTSFPSFKALHSHLSITSTKAPGIGTARCMRVSAVDEKNRIRNGEKQMSSSISISKSFDRTISTPSPSGAKHHSPSSSQLLDGVPFQSPKFLDKGSKDISAGGILPLMLNERNNLYAKSEDGRNTLLLESSHTDSGGQLSFTSAPGGGIFASFTFPVEDSQHDIRIGKLPKTFPSSTRFITHSRIKRWWMAPTFGVSADEVPIETQLLLVEISRGIDSSHLESETSKGYDGAINNNANRGKFNGFVDELRSSIPSLSIFRERFFQSKVYLVMIPLIDYDRGFRCTLFGGKEGGFPAGQGILAARVESGDPQTRSEKVENAVFLAAGEDPYSLMEYAYSTISQSMGTFRTRSEKPVSKALDKFGFCTWDAFYSKVDSEKVISAVKSLQDIGVPPRFVIIDDGWQSTAPSGRHRTEGKAVSDGDLSGAQIDGALAAKQYLEAQAANRNTSEVLSFFLGLGTRAVTNFYKEIVEKSPTGSWSVNVWSYLSQTILKENLMDFFALQTDFSKRLTSWKANLKFEDPKKGKTLKQFVQKLKSEMAVEQVFVWHALSGYWGGISENTNDELPKTLQEPNNLTKASSINSEPSQIKVSYSKPTPHLLQLEPALAWDPSALAGCGTVAIDQLSRLYRQMHDYLADAGVDGVKVDAQSGIAQFGVGNGGGAAIARACVQAVEKSVKAAFSEKRRNETNLRSSAAADVSDFTGLNQKPSKKEGRFLWRRAASFLSSPFRALKRRRRQQLAPEGGQIPNKVADDSSVALVGCMCHSTENLLNYYETSMARASDDFYPKDTASQTVHLVSCAYNSVMLGEIATTDWDMFHSLHPFAEMHAAARAVSGGPVYVSDTPGKHDPELLKRLVLPDGRVLRASLPARPTVDCLFRNVMEDRETAMKIWTRNPGGGGVVAAFNLQGSSWSRKERKYVQHEQRPGTVRAEVRPSDVSGGFTADFKPTTGIGREGKMERKEPEHSKNLGFSRGSLLSRVASVLNLVKAPVRFLFRFDGTKSVRKDSSSKSDFTGGYVAWLSNKKRLHVLESKNTAIEVVLPPKDWEIVTFEPIMTVCRKAKDSNNYTAQMVDVEWAPIGLIDMLNTGGAVAKVYRNVQSTGKKGKPSATFLSKGSGKFGVYSNASPKSVTVDSHTVPFVFDESARLIEFIIPTSSKPDKSTSGILLTPATSINNIFSSADLFDKKVKVEW